MEIIKATTKYSTFKIIEAITFDITDDIIPKNSKVVQIGLIDKYFIIEYVPEDNINLYIEEKCTNNLEAQEEILKTKDDKFKEACDIVLNTDPLKPYKHNNQRLGEILKEDKDWIIWAKTNLRNPYILNFVNIICEHEGI